MSKPPRPRGITILSILGAIGGFLVLLAGGLVLGAANYSTQSSFGNGALSGVLGLIAFFFLASGAISIAVSWGMWYGRGWAWTVAAFLYALGILSALISAVEGASVVGGPLAVVSVEGLFLYPFLLIYLFTPGVRSYFGKRKFDLLR